MAAVTGYQCQKCWATFIEDQSCGGPEADAPKCPHCESAEVKKVDLPESWIGRARSTLRFG